jgi:threonine/homoserine/homoserine lactone efflux protein
MERGRLAGVSVAAGIVCGSASWGIAAVLGLSALMLANAWAVEVLRYVGAADLLFRASPAAKSALRNTPMATVGAAKGGPKRMFLKGFLIHITNPKAIFAWGAVFAVIVPPGAAPVVLAETFFALIAVSNIVFFGYAIMFSSPVFVRGYQKMRRWFEGGFAIMFGFAGFKILTTRISG